MNYLPLLKKFFKQNQNNVATDKDAIKTWIAKENNFNIANYIIYNFLSMVTNYCDVNGYVYNFNWKKIEKDFNIKYNGD